MSRSDVTQSSMGSRRNPNCSNCGDLRGGPFGHEISECTWKTAKTRRERELEVLSRLAADTTLHPVMRAEAVLTMHQRVSDEACGCGWSGLGRSFARHQAEELRRVGLL